MTEPAALRLGMIGCGRLAELGYGPAAHAAADFELVAVSDPDRTRRGLLARRTGATAHATAAALLAAGPLDGVVVCSSPEHHEEAADAVAAAGITALLEQPPSPDVAGSLRIAALSPAPWIGFSRRFDQGLKLAGRVPAFGDLQLRLVLHYRRKSWRPISRDDDALLDLAPHLIDLALMLTGAAPIAVRAQSERERAGIELATTRARVRIECATNRSHRELVEVRDAVGRRVVRVVRGGSVRWVAGRLSPGGRPLVQSLTRQLEAYARALRGEDPGPLATAAEGAATMCVLDAARRSDALGGETMQVEGVTVQA